MRITMKQWLVVVGICAALSGCGGDGPTAESTGVSTTPAKTPGRVQFSVPSLSVSEAAGTATVTITRTNGSDGAVTVRVESRDGTAVAGADYTAVNTTVTFVDGDSAPKTIAVTIANDTVVEPDETLYLTLTVQSGGANRGATYELLLTINDDDVAPPTAAPKAVISSSYRQLHIDWTGVVGATSYRVLKSATANAPFVQVGEDLPATARSTDIEIVLMQEDWLNARYRIAACNSGGCTESESLSVAGLSVPLIGYLKPPHRKDDQLFGEAIALSADGNTLVVGAPYEDSGATGVGGNPVDDCDAETPTNCSPDSGAVFIYTRTGSTWSAPVYIKATNVGTTNAFDYFGSSVALSADGNVLAVGAPYEDSSSPGTANEGASSAGAVYVYTRGEDGNWSGPQYLKASNPGEFDYFGTIVALSGDGTVLAVGATGEASSATGIGGIANDDAPWAGAVYVFTRSGSTWSGPVYVKASNTHPYAWFGYSLALNADGTTLAVGATDEDSGATGIGGNQVPDRGVLGPTNCALSSGAVYVYSRNGATWSSTPVYIKAPQAENFSNFGWSLSLSDDGNLLAVTQPWGDNGGAVHSYVRSNGTWSLFASITSPSEDTYTEFGRAVALSRDGNTLAVGASWDSTPTAHIGAETDAPIAYSGNVYVYKRSATEWSAPTYVKAPNPTSDVGFGMQVALSADGLTMVVGAPWEDSAATGLNGDQFNDCDPINGTGSNCASNSGAVYIY